MSAMPQPVAAGAPVVKDWKQFARTYTAHPLAEIFPMIDPKSKDYGSLLGSVSVFGVIDPIVLTRDMRVLDGRNRLRAALESVHADDTEKAPKFVFFDQLPIDHELVSERDYVASKNLSRRHLSDEQKAAAVALLFHGYTEKATEARKEAVRKVGRGRKAAQEPDEMGGGEIAPTYQKPAERTRDKVQREAGVSEHKARQALRVVEADPELAKQVVAGEVSLKQASKLVEKVREEVSPTKRAAPLYTGDVFVDDAISRCLQLVRKHVGALASVEQRLACAERLCVEIQKLAREGA